MKKFKIVVENEYTLRATSEYVIEEKSLNVLEKKINDLDGDVLRAYSPISTKNEIDDLPLTFNIGGGGYQEVLEIMEVGR